MRLVAAVLITVLTSGLGASSAFGHGMQPGGDGGAAAELPPSPAMAMAAYRIVDDWVRGLAAPDAPPAELPAVVGAAVMLRLDGQVVGRGSVVTGLADRANVWAAARDAIAEARRRTPRATDLLQEEAIQKGASRLTISLELAGPLTPILPAAATYADAELRMSPGLDGVAVRFGKGEDAKYGAIFPSQMLSTNVMPHQALAAAASLAAGDATMGVNEPKDLREKHGAGLLRFRTTHLAQTGQGEEPVFLSRGMKVVGMTAMSTAGLREMAEGIFGHLVTVGRAADRPGSGVAKPERNDRLLVRAAVDGFAVAVRKPTFEEDGVLAGLTLNVDGPGQTPEAEADRAVEAALTMIAYERTEAEQREKKRKRAGGKPVPLPKDVVEVRDAIFRVVAADGTFLAEVPAAARGVIAMGLVCVAGAERAAGEGMPGDIKTMDVAEATVRRLIRETPPEKLVALMPWLGWAEMRLADLKLEISDLKDGGKPARGEIPSAIALRRMREQVWAHMLTAAECGGDNADLVGGIVFNKTKVLLPTWQSARPLAFIATMLGDERLTEPAEFNGELVKLLTALRFLRQLQADESAMWMAADRQRTVGGIRASAWDQRMPIDASAMTLMAVCETLKSLEKRAAMGKAEAPEGVPARPPAGGGER